MRRVNYTISVLSLVLAVFMIAQHAAQSDITEGFQSVELGLAELSPRGEMGGIAIPASGASCVGSFCTPGTQPPQASLLVRNSGAAWTENNITIYAGEDLDLRWSSLHATACSGVNFTASGVSGLQMTVIAPAAGTSRTYTVTCTQGTLTASDSIIVTARATPAPQCNDNVNNDSLEDSYIDFDGGSTPVGATTCWVKGTGSCSAVCGGVSGTYAGSCTSGEARSAASVAQLFSEEAYTYGCWPDSNGATCQTNLAGVGTQTTYTPTCTATRDDPAKCQGWNPPLQYMCYVPSNSNRDGDSTDLSVGCNCNVPDASLCTTPPAPVYGIPDPGCVGPDDPSESNGPPTADLQVRSGTMSWTGNNITIAQGQDLDLKWSSSNATACTGVNLSTSNAANGTLNNLSGTSLPTVGVPKTYRVNCTRAGQPTATDFLTVTMAAAAQPPSINATPLVVRTGESTTLTWDTGTSDPASCSTSGSGFTVLAFSQRTGTVSVPVIAETVFTISCPTGTDSVRVKVLPVIQET